jgi:hypothetical protein
MQHLGSSLLRTETSVVILKIFLGYPEEISEVEGGFSSCSASASLAFGIGECDAKSVKRCRNLEGFWVGPCVDCLGRV